MRAVTDSEMHEFHPDSLVADRLGNLYDAAENLVHPSPIADSISDTQFWCIVCKEVKEGRDGFVASMEIGGYMCAWHEEQFKPRGEE